MKKFLSTGIIVIMLLGLVACGQKENSNDNKAETVENIEVDNSIRNLSEEEKTKLVAETPELDLDNFWFTLDSNKAKAKTNYEGKIYKISLSVMNIETDYFENMTKEYEGAKLIRINKKEAQIPEELAQKSMMKIVCACHSINFM